MSHHSQHHHDGSGHAAKPHVKWVLIVGVVLMLAAMLGYVLSMDEAVVPGQPVQQPVPAAP
jgi:hypothetical protein